MKYNEEAFNMSHDTYNKVESINYEDDTIKSKQDKILKLLLGKSQEQLKENKNNVILPYPVGSYVTTKEDGILHIDQIHQYVYDRNGLGVILELETLSDPRLSTRIAIEEFLTNWTIYDVPRNTSKKRTKQL